MIPFTGAAPQFPVRVPVPDLSPFVKGNHLPGVWSFCAPRPGPHVVIVSLVHGNEIAGAAVLSRWLHEELRPLRGRLSLVFANLDAFSRFDPADPTLSRYVEEDMNRIWAAPVLAGGRQSVELRRARELLPLIEDADILLDLHSALWPSDPLILCAGVPRAHALALRLGDPCNVVLDGGHPEGRRLIDHPRFAGHGGQACALLVEGGCHWEAATATVLDRSARALLQLTGLLPAGTAQPPMGRGAAWQVTHAIVARGRDFSFLRPYRGGEVIARRNTLIALDGAEEIRTPYDNCLLVLPGQVALPGYTVVRLARPLPG